MTNEEVRQKLMEMSDENYKEFSSTLIPDCNNMLGVRIPELRKLAKGIAKEDYINYLADAKDDFFEEVMLQGFVIGYAKCDIDKRLGLIKDFVPKIKDWSVNDSFCATLKFTKENRQIVFKFLKKYIQSDKEFEQRFVAVMLINYFMTDEYIDEVLCICNLLNNEGYYTKMGVAWAVATAYCEYPEKTKRYLETGNTLDDFTFNKAIQKITESYKVNVKDKELLRKMKRKERV